jgi:molybdate transport system ATP-binding protein
LLLLDEPLSALDTEMRLKLQDHILKLHKEFHLTTILVSHDFSEIHKMSDTIIILENGKIRSTGIPSEVLLNQQNSKDINLIGEVVQIENDLNPLLCISVGNNIIRISVDEKEFRKINIGDTVFVSLKALNTVIKKIS